MRPVARAFLLLVLAALLSPATARAQCVVTGDGDPEDHERARLACDRAQTGFQTLFGRIAPAGTIEVSDSVAQFSFEQEVRGWRITWPSTARIRTRFAMDDADMVENETEYQWTTVLPHEIGHLMLTRFVSTGVGIEEGQYGTQLPDWFDEAVAVWMEPLDSRNPEIGQLQRGNVFIPPLDELLGWKHPVMNGEVVQGEGSVEIVVHLPCARMEPCPGRIRRNETMQVRTQRRPDGSTVVDTTYYAGNPASGGSLDSYFYIYSAALLRYIVGNGGTPAINELLARWRVDPNAPSVLTGLPGLADTDRELARNWQDWFYRSVLRRTSRSLRY